MILEELGYEIEMRKASVQLERTNEQLTVIAGSSLGVRVDASTALGEAMLNLRFAIAVAEAQIRARGLPEVTAHPAVLVHIFQNLLGNAVKYRSANSPFVQVSAERKGAFWQFTVADNGRGFPPSKAETIFGVSTRGHGREHAGTGNGLSICRYLVETYAGQIWAESEPGIGSKFHFTLPAEAP